MALGLVVKHFMQKNLHGWYAEDTGVSDHMLARYLLRERALARCLNVTCKCMAVMLT